MLIPIIMRDFVNGILNYRKLILFMRNSLYKLSNWKIKSIT